MLRRARIRPRPRLGAGSDRPGPQASRGGHRLTLVDRVASFLFDRRMLLVLDNCEHVPTAAMVVAELLAGCPLLEVLATSRGSLRLSGEHEFPVAPLALPDPERSYELDVLGVYPGVELFVERAKAVRPDFRFGG